MMSVLMARIFATGDDTVMTGVASSKYLEVVHPQNGLPKVGRVAVLADICCLNVRWVFTGSSHTVMAVTAVIYDVCVVEVGR